MNGGAKPHTHAGAGKPLKKQHKFKRGFAPINLNQKRTYISRKKVTASDLKLDLNTVRVPTPSADATRKIRLEAGPLYSDYESDIDLSGEIPDFDIDPELGFKEDKDIPTYRKPHPYEDMAPFIVKRPKRRFGDKFESSAAGERLQNKYWNKFENDASYNIMKETTGFNKWYESEAVINPQNGVMRDFYTKQYKRDPTTLEATIPKRFVSSVDYDELQTVLQKADHYFFEERPCPTAQLLVPLQDPRSLLPNSPLSKMVTNLEKKHNVGLPFSLGESQREKINKATQELTLPRLRDDHEVLRYLEGEVSKVYKDSMNGQEDYLNHLNSVDQRVPDMSLVHGQHFTAQMRRAEFWRKYLELFQYVDILHTTMVRCTRSIGRVGSYAALVIMGNGNGIFTYGRGKAPVKEQAIRVALLKTRRNVLFTPLHENRSPYYRIQGKFKQSSILLIPQARGVGLRAGRLTFTLLRCVGYKDASAKLRGRPNIWNIIRSWMECLKYQESYREIANMRGQHYQQFCNPWVKNPPVPSREEVQELEDVASQAFKEAVIDVFRGRQLFETETFKDIEPHFTERANFNEKWDRYLDMANVPQSVRLYPGFSEYLDATKLLKEKRFREEVHSEFEDAWSPTETETEDAYFHSLQEQAAEKINAINADTTLSAAQKQQQVTAIESSVPKHRTARHDQPYYQYYKGTAAPEFNRKAQRFANLNKHIEDLAGATFYNAVGLDGFDPQTRNPSSQWVLPTETSKALHLAESALRNPLDQAKKMVEQKDFLNAQYREAVQL